MTGPASLPGRIVLQRARPDQRELAYQIKRAAFKPQFERTGTWDDSEQRQRHEQRFTTQDYRFVCVDETPVGIMGVVVSEECVRLNQFFVLPAWQGRGVGQRAISLLLQEADGLGRPLRLQVMKDNPRGFSFYVRLGFSVVDETATHHTMEHDAARPDVTEDVAF